MSTAMKFGVEKGIFKALVCILAQQIAQISGFISMGNLEKSEFVEKEFLVSIIFISLLEMGLRCFSKTIVVIKDINTDTENVFKYPFLLTSPGRWYMLGFASSVLSTYAIKSGWELRGGGVMTLLGIASGTYMIVFILIRIASVLKEMKERRNK